MSANKSRAHITSRRQGELLEGVLSILGEHPDGLPASQVLARLAERVPRTAFERSTYPDYPSVNRFDASSVSSASPQ
jgi:NAD-dependent oxidoreductase involved in siderophore biosynthesis